MRIIPRHGGQMLFIGKARQGHVGLGVQIDRLDPICRA